MQISISNLSCDVQFVFRESTEIFFWNGEFNKKPHVNFSWSVLKMAMVKGNFSSSLVNFVIQLIAGILLAADKMGSCL